MTDAPATPNQPQQPQLTILRQYVKDLSFENPGAPDTLRAGAAAPAIDLSFDVQARSVQPDIYEVMLNVEARATREDNVIFIVELAYAGLFQMTGFADPEREAMLLIECPRLIFPYARKVLADTTQEGGFPPLMLDPVDFAGLYRQQLAKRQAAAQGQEPNGTADPSTAN